MSPSHRVRRVVALVTVLVDGLHALLIGAAQGDQVRLGFPSVLTLLMELPSNGEPGNQESRTNTEDILHRSLRLNPCGIALFPTCEQRDVTR